MKLHDDAPAAVAMGASARIGRPVAVELGGRGASAALPAGGSAGLDAMAAEVEEAGGRALPITLDVAEADVRRREPAELVRPTRPALDQ